MEGRSRAGLGLVKMLSAPPRKPGSNISSWPMCTGETPSLEAPTRTPRAPRPRQTTDSLRAPFGNAGPEAYRRRSPLLPAVPHGVYIQQSRGGGAAAGGWRSWAAHSSRGPGPSVRAGASRQIYPRPEVSTGEGSREWWLTSGDGSSRGSGFGGNFVKMGFGGCPVGPGALKSV